MLQRFFGNPLMFMILWGACLSSSPGDDRNHGSDHPSIQGVKPGISDDSPQSQKQDDRGTGREEIAQADLESGPYPRDGHFRMGDWDYRENWRYDRDAFYRGETQPQAYREEHPYGSGGIGYDADINYGRNLRRYRQFYQQNPTPPNRQSLYNYENPYHTPPYQGNYGEGSYHGAYGNRYFGQ